MMKILIAVDFSENCDNAIKYIQQMIIGSDTIIDLVHVYSIPVVTLTTMTSKVIDKVISDNKEYITELLDEQIKLFPKKNRGTTHAVYGIYASSDIIDKAIQINADLIVMGFRQKYSMIDRFLGTVTANTIAKSQIPVLAIPNGSTYTPDCNILFPTEMSYSKTMTEENAKQLDHLFDVCNNYKNPRLYMVHINEDTTDKLDITYQYNPFPDIKFIVSTAPTLEDGILKIVKSNDITLIAIQRKTRKFWERLYHSSLTRKLLFQARLPILIINS